MKIVHVVAAGVMVMFLGFGSVSEAYSVPGVDRPYDSANYYSKDSISYADSAPSPFALRELMQGNVYDYTRHIKSILFGDKFEGWLANLMDSNMRWLRDMLGLGNRGSSVLAEIENGNKDFGIPDWLQGDNYFVNYNSKWLRTGYDSNDKYGWMAKIFAEGIENARKNQGDLDERMGTLNDILENSRVAEGNMEAMQSETQMQGLMDSEITRRSRMLANHPQVQAAGDRLRLDKERRAMLAEDRVMTFKIMDRNNMTEQDSAVGVKEGSGFKNF
ncbi:hypothetical protein [Selenomonas ruminantium]|uniref:Uncharacterized protein n=1 Tax=Selenomonas ruminantium TaxID=971 RepID=A0A1I0V3Q4_SELRU|nr:hypothetical protein [Selenomonas ruminantium]SFA70948.1 hypothetical protein SAMN05216587_101235 [Selenomonas ruminantium]